SAKQITETTEAILRAARREAGVHIVLATARPPRSVMPFYSQLELDTPMVNYNGALVYDPISRRVLMHRPVSAKISRGIVRLAREKYPGVLVSAEVLDRWYTDRVDDRYATATARHFRPDVLAPIEQWLTTPVTKLLLLGEPDRLLELARDIHAAYPHQVQIVRTEGELLQIMHATVSKAQALRAVAGEMGVTREQVMAIGDNANDVEMLRWAGIGVAMANAAPEALAAADVVTDHHDSDGAARAIHRLILDGLETR
ncbi:MAG TPA: Cof-type HAD-IIB family hydrolase, partial [Phycisphaerae bacterium]|nr:Cof-type HAD-IIB family hydrolase [Phycisphaerae bacterium]